MTETYPKNRLCEVCGHEVPVDYRDKTVHLPLYGEIMPITFKAGYCSVCGALLCERGFDDAMFEIVRKHEEEEKA